jgi:ankyrin repeat protein
MAMRLIRRLHEAGAELNVRTNDGQTPEEAAAKGNHPQAVVLIRELAAAQR